MTETTPSGGQYPEAASDEAAPDQTEVEREATTLAGLVQSGAEAQGWTSEVVQSGDGTVILGLTAPSGRDFSLELNPTP